MDQMLDSEEAARRLGVKVSSLYSYVSRGLLESHPASDGRRSCFAREDVEALARRGRGGKQVETRLATITTGITQLGEHGPVYRGVAATNLAATTAFEDVAERLWRTGHERDEPGAQPDTESAAEPDAEPAAGPGEWRPAFYERPSELAPVDLLRWAVVEAGAEDRLRSDRRPEAIMKAARKLIATVIAVLPPRSARRPAPVTYSAIKPRRDLLAGRLAVRLVPRPDDPEIVHAINAAMVLVADHELATSTLAVRLAASVRSDLYDAVLSGMGAMGGALHGGAAEQSVRLLLQAEAEGADSAIDDALRWRGVVPGFGGVVYPRADRRATVLLDLVDTLANDRQREVVYSVIGLAERQGLPPPNVDLAIAALAYATGMQPDDTEILFTVARMAGWTAHYLEELGERPLRFRVRAVYASSG